MIAGVRKDRLRDASELGVDKVVALDDVSDFEALPQVMSLPTP